MLLADVASKLAALSYGTVGTSIFYPNWPDDTSGTYDDCIKLTQYAGKPPSSVGNLEFPGLQVWVRDHDYSDGEAIINNILDDLHQLTYQTINTRLYYRFESQGSWAYMGKDAKDRHQFLLNMIVTKTIE